MTAAKIQQGLLWWQARKRSEQILLGVSLAVGLIMGLQRFVIAPLNNYAATLTTQLDAQHTELRQAREKLSTVGPDELLQVRQQARQRLLALQAELAQARAAMTALRESLVPAGSMADVVGGLLRNHRNVKLAEILNLPAVALRAPATAPITPNDLTTKAAGEANDTAAASARASAGPTLYKHPMRIVLRGRYIEIAKYLAAIEDLPWRVYFDGLILEVQDYPMVEATVELHTLSEDEGWFFTS